MVALGVIGHELDAPQYFVSYWFCFALLLLIMIPAGLIRYIIEGE